MRRFVQGVLYVDMAFLTLAALIGFLAHKFPIAAQEQALARQVGFVILGVVVTLWIVSRFWRQETRLLLIPIVFNIVGVIHHGFDAVIVNANLGLPAPPQGDIYVPLVADVVFLALFAGGYMRLQAAAGTAASRGPANPA